VTGYEILVLLHVLAAITWVGGAITITLLAAQMERSDDPTVVAVYLRQTEWLGRGMFPIAAVAVLVLGITMVAVNEAWTIGQLWILLALIGVAITFTAGAAFFGPEARRIGRLAGERGAADPEVRRRLQRVSALSRFDLLLLLLIVADMVIKPGL
jgi:uncharacterized membrane protein